MYDTTKPYKNSILELIKQTWETPHVSIKEGTYPIIERKFLSVEVDHTDGVGTKGIYHWKQRAFRNASLDALAMNLNDLAMARAIPYKTQNHIIIPKDDKEAILEIIESLVNECKKRRIAITGGETSIHDYLDGLDISLTVSGFVKNYQQNRFEEGDILIGMRSSGLHSNGFTKLREVFGEEYRDDFIIPTEIYFDKVLSLIERFDIHGMMHITGGAFTKLKGLLYNCDVRLYRKHKLVPQKIFEEVYEKNVSDEEMYKTFNCGIGFILSVSQDEANKIVRELDSDIVGEITKGTGKVSIESMFSNRKIEF